MFTLTYSHQFKKDLKHTQRDPQFRVARLEHVLEQLQDQIMLESKYRLHRLKGYFAGCYECHVQPDTLLIFEVDTTAKLIYLLRLGSHAELF